MTYSAAGSEWDGASCKKLVIPSIQSASVRDLKTEGPENGNMGYYVAFRLDSMPHSMAITTGTCETGKMEKDHVFLHEGAIRTRVISEATLVRRRWYLAGTSRWHPWMPRWSEMNRGTAPVELGGAWETRPPWPAFDSFRWAATSEKSTGQILEPFSRCQLFDDLHRKKSRLTNFFLSFGSNFQVKTRPNSREIFIFHFCEIWPAMFNFWAAVVNFLMNFKGKKSRLTKFSYLSGQIFR